jgi:hypothetical protein
MEEGERLKRNAAVSGNWNPFLYLTKDENKQKLREFCPFMFILDIWHCDVMTKAKRFVV